MSAISTGNEATVEEATIDRDQTDDPEQMLFDFMTEK